MARGNSCSPATWRNCRRAGKSRLFTPTGQAMNASPQSSPITPTALSAMSHGEGDGLLLFKNAYEYARQLADKQAIHITLSAGEDAAPNVAAYAASGVNIAAAERAKRLMQEAVRSTQGPEVLAGMGAFAGMFSASRLQKMRRPVLVASTDSVGTKTLIAAQAGRFTTIGHDLVHHCVNDMLTQGAEPLFFMDYLAVDRLDPVQAAAIV